MTDWQIQLSSKLYQVWLYRPRMIGKCTKLQNLWGRALQNYLGYNWCVSYSSSPNSQKDGSSPWSTIALFGVALLGISSLKERVVWQNQCSGMCQPWQDMTKPHVSRVRGWDVPENSRLLTLPNVTKIDILERESEAAQVMLDKVNGSFQEFCSFL